METKHCPYCGEEILIVAKKCKHCGEWLTESDAAARKTEAAPAPPAKKKTYSKPYVPKWLLIVVTVLAVIGSILSSIATATKEGELEFGVLSLLFDTALAIVGIVVVAKAGERWRSWGITYFAATIVGGLLALSGNDYLSVLSVVLIFVCVIGLIVALYKNGRKSLGEQWLNMLGLTVLALFAGIAGVAIAASVGKELYAAVVVVVLMLLADLLGYIVIFNLLDKVNSEEKTTFIDYYFKTLCKIWLVLIAVVAVKGITSLRGKKPHRRIDRMAQTIGIAYEDEDDGYRRGEVFEPVEEVEVYEIRHDVPPSRVYLSEEEIPQYFFDGQIDDRIDIQMGIGMPSGSKYCYMKYGPDNSMTLKVKTYDTYDENHLVMDEYNSEGVKTGTWDGYIYHERYGGSERAPVFYYKGTVDFNGKEMSFCLYEVPAEQSVYKDEPFIIAETMPTFQGGDLNTFRNWVQQNVHYPQIAQENGISGRVVMSFVIEKDGTLTNIQVLHSPDRSLSDEAARVLQKSPKWEPGKQGNQAVRVKYTLPVDFRP